MNYRDYIFQSPIFQSLIYTLGIVLLLLSIHKNINITDIFWTRGLIFILMVLCALPDIRDYLKLHYSKKEKISTMMTIEFITKVAYTLLFPVFCYI